jgi:peptide/nickel transport system substrate-binding protein
MVTKYPFDLGRSEQLMAEAGFAKRPGDFYVGRGGAAFSAEVRTDFGDYIETLSAVANGWRQAGFEFREMVVPQAQAQDLQVKSTYPGVLLSSTSAGEASLNSMGTDNIPRPENQWRGTAWDGYSNPELDRLITAVGAALDPAVRNRAAADLVKLYSSEVPAISMFFNINPWVFTSNLKGPMLRPAVSNVAWNIHEWELTAS